MDRQQFVSIVAPIAVKVRIDGGPLFPSVSIAQTILETGGKIHGWYNIVGYKVGSGALTPYWRGKSVSTKTWEVYDGVRHDNVKANWRAYECVEDCLKDQALLFLNNRRYDRVVAAKTPIAQAIALYDCGYATDPAYYEKIIRIFQSGGYERYDKEAVQAMELLKELQREIEGLKDQVKALEDKQSMPMPVWAKDAVAAAVNAGIVDSPNGGSYDFYRNITVMYRGGLLPRNDSTIKGAYPNHFS